VRGARIDGSAVPNEAARENAYRMLERDLLAGKFEQGGYSQVLFLHPGVTLTHRKMTRSWLRELIKHNLDNEHGRLYLRLCWLRRNLFERWCRWHHLLKLLPRFQPQETHAVSTAHGNEAAATKNKGGAPPKADWDALKEPLRAEIKKHGYPHRQNPPGWQRTKDVVDWALTMLGTTSEHVSPRTVEDNVRRILKELRASGQ